MKNARLLLTAPALCNVQQELDSRSQFLYSSPPLRSTDDGPASSAPETDLLTLGRT